MFFYLLCFDAFASDITTEFSNAKEAYNQKDYALMEEHLLKVEKLMGNHTRLIKPKQLSDIWMLRSLANHERGKEVLDDFRKALILHPNLTWDRKFLDDDMIRDVFYAISSEINYYYSSPQELFVE